jgi:hypothetical protein
MSETKHTPALNSIEVTNTKKYSSWDELKASTALENAAPDMLAALEAVVKELIYSRGEVFGPSDEEIVKLAKAAIAKAKGGAK